MSKNNRTSCNERRNKNELIDYLVSTFRSLYIKYEGSKNNGAKNRLIMLPAYGIIDNNIETLKLSIPNIKNLPKTFIIFPLTNVLLVFMDSIIFILLSKYRNSVNEYHIPNINAGTISKINPKIVIRPKTKLIHKKNWCIFKRLLYYINLI